MGSAPVATSLAPIEGFTITFQGFLLTILGWATLPATLLLTRSSPLSVAALLLSRTRILFLVSVVGTVASKMIWGATPEARFSLGFLNGFLVGTASVFPHVVLENIGLRCLAVARMLGRSPQTIIDCFTVHRLTILTDGLEVQAMALHVTLFGCVIQELDGLHGLVEL
jgi:hypothetical protein